MFPRIRRLALWIASIWLAACSSPREVAQGKRDSELIHIRGTITELPTRHTGAAFLIEEKVTGIPAEPATAGAKYYVYVTPETGIQRRTSTGSARGATLAEITAGMKAEVWFLRPIRESYPMQGTAARILILDPAP
jgi:hypothetical protein